MIQGTVNTRLEPVIPVTVFDPTGQRIQIDATIDTGFTGELTLSPTTIGQLGLPRIGEYEVQLADGSWSKLEYFLARVEWDGSIRDVRVILIDSSPLAGLGLLQGYRLTIDAIGGGPVTIEPIP
jgi:clan AA aspartic protease